MGTPTITANGAPIVGECFTKDYGTVKINWTISNPDNYVLTKIVIERDASSGYPSTGFPAKTITLENYLKSGFDSPYAGEWTDTGLALPMDCDTTLGGSSGDQLGDEDLEYTITLHFVGGTDSFDTGVDGHLHIPCCGCDETEWGEWSDKCDAPDDLELLYRFDTDQQPYIKDETSNFNHGRVRGGAKIVTDVYSATSTSSLKIPGEGSYVSIPSHPSLDFGEDVFTIDFWIYLNIATTPESDWSAIFQSANFIQSQKGIRLTFNSGNYEVSSGVYNVPYFQYEDGEGTPTNEFTIINFPVVGTATVDLAHPTHSAPSNFVSKTWHHIRLSRASNGDIELYLNGSGITGAGSSVVSTTEIYHGDDGFEIGSSKPGYPSFDGYIDNFRIQREDPVSVGTTTYFDGGCLDFGASPKCWDSHDSKLSIWMEGYFENPITGEASFDLKYYLNEKCAWGIGDSRIYFNLPNQANLAGFTPSSNLLLPADCTIEEASDGGKYPGRWKLDIAHPSGGDADFYKEINPVGYDCDNTKVLFKFNQPIDTTQTQDIPNYADMNNGTVSIGDTPTISSINKKFGASSLDLSSGYVKFTPAAGVLSFADEFTIDFWVYSEDQFEGNHYDASGVNHSYFLRGGLSFEYTYNTASDRRFGTIQLNFASDAYSGGQSPTSYMHYENLDPSLPGGLKNKKWNHIAVIRDSSAVMRVYCNGVELSVTQGNTHTYPTGTIDLITTSRPDNRLGGTIGNIPILMDEFRISSGARWTANFTPPTATTACHEINTSTLLPPTHGTFGTVYIDKPLGEGRVCFDTDETKLEVWSRLAGTSGTGYKESITYDSTGNIAKDYNASGLPKWQTGPCLSTCTDEAEIGYGDHYFKPKPFDNNTVDVEYCLTRDNIDTFVIACITTDFKTGVSSIDKEFGDAIDNGWDVKVKNICPGFSIVYGHGEEVISNSGYSTLLRLYLDNNVIQKFPSDPNAKVCMFPLFMKLGNTYDILDDYISKLDSPEMKRLRDSKNAGGKLSNDYETPAFYYNGTDYGSSYSSNANNIVNGWQDGSGFLADLHLIADKIDERFKQMVHYLADAYEIAIKDYSNTDDYIADDGIRNSAIETAHSFRILYSYWLSLLESYPEFKLQFDSYSKSGHPTENDALLDPKLPCDHNGLDVGLRCNDAADKVYIDILYNFPLSSISGVQINFDNLHNAIKSKLTTNDQKLSPHDTTTDPSWGGDARDNNYLQAFSEETNNYICVYGGDVSDLKAAPKNNYLRSDISQKNLPVLTTIVIDVSHSNWDNYFNTAAPVCLDSDSYNIIGSLEADTYGWYLLYNAVIKDLLKAKFVSNEKTTDVVHYDGLPKWTGNSYKASIDDSLDVRDLLTTVVLAIEPNGDDGLKTVDLSEANIESVIKLPANALLQNSGRYKTVKNYYNLPSLDLTGITYKTISDTGTYPWVDSDSGKRILSTIDVSNDGIVDIVDVVALRNVWTALGEYPVRLDQVENTILPVVPNEPCTVYDVNAELFSADSCSTFCIADPDCFSKLWISDMIVLRDEEGNPDNYLFEVSYSFDYSRPYSSSLSNWTLSSCNGTYPNCVATTHQWSIVDGRMKQAGNDGYALALYNTAPASADVRVDVNIECQDDDAVEIILRYTDDGSYYAARFHGGDTNTAGAEDGSGRYTRIYKWVGGGSVGVYTNIATITGVDHGFVAGEAFDAAFEFVGDTYKVYKNGSVVLTGTDSSLSTAGQVGIRCNNGINTYFDNFTFQDGFYTIEDFSGVQFKVEGLTGVGIAGTENGTGELDQIDATAVRAKSWDERILSSDATTNDTYFSFSSNAEYITKGKGVLTYLKVSPDSLPDQDEWIEQRLAEGYVKTNRKLKVDSNPILGFLEEEAGMSVSYPMANLRFKSHHTDELMIYEKFGVRIGDPKISYNRSYDTSVDPMTVIGMGDVDSGVGSDWTGESGDDSNITNLDLDYVLNLAATNGYEAKFDANEDGKIDIVDVQTINHIVNKDRFDITASGTVWPESLPSLGCPVDDLIAPSLVALDYTAAVGTTLDVVRGGNTRTIDIVKTGTTNQLLCLSDYNYTGGIILYWEYVDGADYYTVYRQSPGEKAVPIISSAPGNAGNLDSFAPRPYGAVKDPVEIMPNFWIDFPPVLTNKCDNTTNVVEAEDFKYWVEAVRRSETSKSVEKTKGVVNCRKLPTSSDINFVVEMDQEYNGAFNVTHPYAIPPIGPDATPEAAYPLWMYSQKSGDGNVGISDKGGRIITKSSRPSNTGAEGSNELGFSYKPKKKFIGKDTFKYTATVLDKDLINDPALWCKDDGDVTVYVIPQNPDVYAHIGNCPTPETILKWNSVYGATSYKVYEYNTTTSAYDEKQTIAATANTDNYEAEVMDPTIAGTGTWYDWNAAECPTGPFSTKYKVTSIAKIGTLELESTGEIITVYSPCCAAITPVSPTVTKTGYCDSNGAGEPSGRVTISWTDVSGYDSYNVYRRGPFTANNAMTDSWELIGDSYVASSATSPAITHEFIDYPDGCVGCDELYYDYFVRAVDEVGTEGPAPASQTTAFDELEIFCCNQDPVAEDQEDETGFGKEITGLQFLANDINNNINTYQITNTVPASEGVVTLDANTGIFDFKPAFNFYGDVDIEWTATDFCGETSNTGTFTITVLPPPDCLIYDYVVCNSKLEFLTYQQDTYGIRKKIATLTQVPFMLNIKGPPSLRGYYGSYTVTGNCGANSNTKGVIVITIDDNSKLLDDVITIITPAGTEITTTGTNDPSTGAGEDDSTFEIKSTAPETADEIADVLDEHPELDVTSDPDEPTVTITMVDDGPGSSVEVTDDGGDGGITSTHEDGTTDPLPPYGAPDDGGVYSPRFGCMDSTMFNYDEDAEVQRDGDCEPFIYGCTDSTASNYDAAANVSDGSCEYEFGLAPSVLFHFNESGSTTAANACASSDVSASGTFVYDSSGKFSTNAAKFAVAAAAAPGHALYHFNDDVASPQTFADAAGGSAGTVVGAISFDPPTSGQWYQSTPHTGFTNYWPSVFDTMVTWTPSTNDPSNYVILPDPEVGAGSFTIEFYFLESHYWLRGAMLSNHSGGQNSGDMANTFWIEKSGNEYIKIHIFDNGSNETTLTYTNSIASGWFNFHTTPYGSNPPKLMAIERSVTSGTATWRLYCDGVVCTESTGTTPSVTNFDLSGNDWRLGYAQTNPLSLSTIKGHTYQAWYDEFRITKSALYNGTAYTPTLTPFPTPSAGSSAGSDFHINTDAPAATDNTNSLYWDGEFVFDMWVKIDDVDENGTIIMPDSIIAGEGMFGLEWLADYPTGAGRWKLLLGASTELAMSDSISDGAWYHVAVVRDGSDDVRFYRDGVGLDMVEYVRASGADFRPEAIIHFDNTFVDETGNSVLSGSPDFSAGGALSSSHSLDVVASSSARFQPPLIAGDFTIECWVKLTSVSLSNDLNTIISAPIYGLSGGDDSFKIILQDILNGQAGELRWEQKLTSSASQYVRTSYSVIGTNLNGTGYNGLVAGQWSHIAVVREITGSTCTISLFVNGYRHAQATGLDIRDITPSSVAGGKYWAVGQLFDNARPWDRWGANSSGQIDEVAVFSNAKYTGQTYTVPTVPYGSSTTHATATGYEFTTTINPNKGLSEALLHFDGDLTNDGGTGDGTEVGSVTFPSSTLGVGFGQQLNITNANSYGGNYVTIPDTGWDDGPFTIEGFIDPTSSEDEVWFSIGTSTTYWITIGQVNGSLLIAQNLGVGSPSVQGFTLTSVVSPHYGTMTHYAFVRGADNAGSSTWRVYIDGSYAGGGSFLTGDWTGKILNIGRWDNTSSGGYPHATIDGHFDELRVSLTDQIYTGTGNITVPTAPFGPLVGSGTGYEVGGASDTPFEGSIDELRIVKDDSEEPIVQTDEYDCS